MNDSQPASSGRRLEFLQSALLVDDRASFGRDPAREEPSPEQESALEDPVEEVIYDPDPATPQAVPPALSEMRPDADDIDPQLLVEAFADLGVACATLAPRETVGLDQARVLRLAANTDIVILDWILRDPGGQQGDRDNQLHVQATNSRDLVRDIVSADATRGGRLRLLCVYTGSRDLEGILNQVAGAVREVHGDAVRQDIDSLEVVAPYLRVVLLAKASNDAGEAPRVAEQALPRRLVEEFRTFADGLLREAALQGLAAVRSSAHRLLLRFPADLDPAFLSHRALVGPTDADEWVTQLITDEVATLAAAPGHAGGLLDQAAVDAAINRLLPESAQDRSMLTRPTGKDKMLVATETARRLFQLGRVGAGLRDKDVGAVLERAASVTLLLLEPDGQGKDLRQAARHDDELAVVSCLARDAQHDGPEQPPPVLGLGSLLVIEDQYFLCVQPLCDTVRLKERTIFPLLPLKPASGGDAFDITISAAQPGAFVRLRSTDGRLRDLRQHAFQPERGSVRAEHRHEAGAPARWIFGSVDDAGQGTSFAWVGDVRAAQAARCALRLSQSASRPGLLESEYQRVRSNF